MPTLGDLRHLNPHALLDRTHPARSGEFTCTLSEPEARGSEDQEAISNKSGGRGAAYLMYARLQDHGSDGGHPNGTRWPLAVQ